MAYQIQRNHKSTNTPISIQKGVYGFKLMLSVDGELGIALRSGQITDREIRIFAGCGIVAGSNPEKELEESNAKMIAMRSALH